MKFFFLTVIASLTLIACESQKTFEQAVIQPEKVVVVGHFYPILKPKYLKILTEQLKTINNINTIVLAGDMVAQSTLDQYNMLEEYFTSQFNVPFHYIPANHEMTNEALFKKIGQKYESFDNHLFYAGGHKFVTFSAHKATEKASVANLDCENTQALANFIKDQSSQYTSAFLVLADMRCFRNKSWRQNIQPLIDEHIDFVIIGDNESTKYSYTWEKYNGVLYIYQGITHRGHALSGENTFLVIHGEDIQVHHLKITNALDPAYQTRKRFEKLQ